MESLTPIVEKNYSKCPLKKRPVNMTFESPEPELSDHENRDEPENLSVKKEVVVVEEEIKEIPVKSEPNNNDSYVSNNNMFPSAATIVMPTATYPKIALQPWGFPLQYSPEFYRNIHHPQPHPHHAYQTPQISPLRGDLHSPSSPSEGSISPPPSYLNGRSSSISPPIRTTDSIYTSVIARNSRVIRPKVIVPHGFVPYQLPYMHPAQPSPVSPSYSECSFFSMRSHSPESSCSIPEDLSVKSLPSYTTVPSTSPASDIQVPVNEVRERSKGAPPRHQCSYCNKSYSTFSGLTKHIQFHCPAAEGNQVKKSFSCKDCDKTYVSLGALKMHIRTHTLPCKCTICGKAFSRPWLLQGHIRTHTGEKPFSCQHCHRAFADRSNLRAHLQTHSDIKKYSCATCSKTFSRMSLLTKHSEGGCPGIQVPGSHPPYLPPYPDQTECPAY